MLAHTRSFPYASASPSIAWQRRWAWAGSIAELATASGHSRIPRLHPNLSALYRQRVSQLRERLEGESSREVLEAARALIERVEIHPPVDGANAPRIELIGHLTSLLRAAGVEGLPKPMNGKTPPTDVDGVCSVSVDAGTGFGLWRTRMGTET